MCLEANISKTPKMLTTGPDCPVLTVLVMTDLVLTVLVLTVLVLTVLVLTVLVLPSWIHAMA